MEENVDNNNNKVEEDGRNKNDYLHDSDSDSDDVISNQDDDDSNIQEVSPTKHIKKPTATKPSFKKFPERIPEEYTIHNYFLCKYTEVEIAFICGVAKIKSPRKLLEYNQHCLAQELECWWNLQAKILSNVTK